MLRRGPSYFILGRSEFALRQVCFANAERAMGAARLRSRGGAGCLYASTGRPHRALLALQELQGGASAGDAPPGPYFILGRSDSPCGRFASQTLERAYGRGLLTLARRMRCLYASSDRRRRAVPSFQELREAPPPVEMWVILSA